MNVIIAGSRSFNTDAAFNFLVERCDFYLQNIVDQQEITIVSGTARGADKLGEKYARIRGYKIKRFPADWDKFGKKAGSIRNKEMAEYADFLIAFWDGSSKGTIDMYRQMKYDFKKPTRIVPCYKYCDKG